jgi:hypothetical protein
VPDITLSTCLLNRLAQCIDQSLPKLEILRLLYWHSASPQANTATIGLITRPIWKSSGNNIIILTGSVIRYSCITFFWYMIQFNIDWFYHISVHPNEWSTSRCSPDNCQLERLINKRDITV